MKFRLWIEAEASLGSQFPEIMPSVNRGAATTASDGVLRTGLQPQVDSKEIHTQQKDSEDRIQAIDAALQRCDSELPQGKQDDFPKVNKFKKMWEKLKKGWDDIKLGQDEQSPEADEEHGLGSNMGDERMLKMLQQHPNMVPIGKDHYPHGPGTFGTS